MSFSAIFASDFSEMDFADSASKLGLSPLQFEFAEYLDSQDELKGYRSLFSIPLIKDVAAKVHDPSIGHLNDKHDSLRAPADMSVQSSEEAIYLCGNSLGLMPKRARQLLNEELDVWSERFF